MDRIGVVGTSYRTTDVSTLGKAALPSDFSDDSLVELARLSGFSEMVYLGTCNRVEFYFRGETRTHSNPLLFHLRHSLADLTGDACQLPDDDHLYLHFGRDAVRHLFRVTAALDSMMVGEAQIGGQTKQAHERAHSVGLLTGILDQCFHEAFHLAKRIRTETDLARRPVSLVTLVERLLHDHLALTTAPVLILGAGEMGAQTLRLVRTAAPGRAVVVANRTSERAEDLVRDDPAATGAPLEAILADPPAASVVVAATSADEVLLRGDHVAALRQRLPRAETLLVVDLALPPNVDPAVRGTAGVILHGIEEMRREAERNRALRLEEIDRCENLVEHQLQVLRRRLLDRALSPVARTLAGCFGEVTDKAVQHALAHELAHLGEADRAAVERMARSVVQRLVQVPLKGLKGAAWHHSSAVVDSFLRGIATGGDTREPPDGGP